MTDYAAVLVRTHPGAEWALDGETYDGLVWLSDGPKPTQADLDAAWPEVQQELAWAPVRAERDRLLAGSDWTQVADAPVDAAAWAVYRQQLRDIPETFASPDDVVWPAVP